MAAMTPETMVQVLRGAEILGELDEAGRAAIAAVATSVRFPAGGWIIRQGDVADALYVVSTGQVRVVASLPDGLEVRVAKDGSDAAGGSILGLMMLGAAKGDSVDIVVSGADCESALLRLVGLIKDGFGED